MGLVAEITDVHGNVRGPVADGAGVKELIDTRLDDIWADRTAHETVA